MMARVEQHLPEAIYAILTVARQLAGTAILRWKAETLLASMGLPQDTALQSATLSGRATYPPAAGTRVDQRAGSAAG
jgi:hypothetical protein